MHVSLASLWVNARDTPGNPRGMVQFWHFSFPRGVGKSFSLDPTSLDHGAMHTGFVRVLVSGISLQTKVFFAPIYFISMPNVDIMLLVFILPPREGLFVINFIPFTQGL